MVSQHLRIRAAATRGFATLGIGMAIALCCAMQVARRCSVKPRALNLPIDIHADVVVGCNNRLLVRRQAAARVDRVLGAAAGGLSGLVVELRPPTSLGYACRVTACMRDGRRIWCTACGVDRWHSAVDDAIDQMGAILERSSRAHRRQVTKLAMCGIGALMLLSLVTFTALGVIEAAERGVSVDPAAASQR